MFDLNIDIFPRNPACRGARTPSEEASGTFQATELSGVSNSSGVNFAGGGDRDSHNSVSALKFDIFSKLRTPPDVVPDNDDEEDGDQVVTWQLFPANGDGGGGGGEGVGGLSCDSEFRVGPSETQWLNLSVSGSGSGSSALERSTIMVPPQQQQARRSRRGPRSRSSQYRGVTFYRRTGRWESHIWDCGKQVYLGGFDTAFAAARAYDRAAIKFRGVDADINFGVTDYQEDMKQMKHLNKEEFVQALRRQSTGVSRGSSRYRGTTLPRCDQWEAPMGQYLAKKAYDKAAIQFSGRETVTNFERSNYEMKMPLEVNRELAHNLDLNLGISISVEQPQGNKNAREVYPLPPLYHPADHHRTMLGSSYGPPSGQALCGQSSSSNQTATWHGSHVVSAIHAERAVQEKQLDMVPSSTSSNWARNIQAGRHGGANQVVPLYPSAASSGFSF